MIWLLLSLGAAFTDSVKDFFAKKAGQEFNEYSMSLALRLAVVALLLPLQIFLPLPSVGASFWTALLISATLNAAATIAYMKAIKSSDLSITIPMINFTPLFLLATSPIISRESPTAIGMAGVTLIVLGSYVLNISHLKEGFLSPWKALLKEPGPRLMLLVALIWSITSNFDKIGVQNSSVVFWLLAMNLSVSAILLPINALKSRQTLNVKAIKSLAPMGFFNAATLVLQMTAITQTFVAYMISVKRLSSAFSVTYGHYFFKEKHLKQRLAGVAIMIAGVIIITLSSV